MSTQDLVSELRLQIGREIKETDSAELEKASAQLDSDIWDLAKASLGPMGQALLVECQDLQAKILDELNSRHGSDGMTPL